MKTPLIKKYIYIKIEFDLVCLNVSTVLHIDLYVRLLRII